MLNTLIHYTQLISYNFLYLKLGITQMSSTPRPHLEKIGRSIDQLKITLEVLSQLQGSIDRGAVHDIRNELSLISSYAQLLNVKYAVELGSGATLYLKNILTVCDLFIQELKPEEHAQA